MTKALADVRYAPTTGNVLYRGRTHGTVNRGGYVVFRAAGKVVYAHRFAFFAMTGRWPKLVDHINGVRTDNRWHNLREVTGYVNGQNKRLCATRKHQAPPGAHFHTPSHSWKSAISVDGVQVHLGYFKNADAAHRAYIAAKRKLHNVKELRYA